MKYLLALTLAGCSLALDWSEDNLPCDTEHQCLSGYSCLGAFCVADESAADGDVCNQDRQCEHGRVCSPEPVFACRKSCAAFYKDTSDCASGEYCRSYDVIDPETDEVLATKGACIPSDCRINEDCDTGEVCVKITSTASACLLGCQVTFNGTTYSDNCGSTSLKPKYCQPMGAPDAQKLVCLSTSNNAAGAGNVCASPITEPCRPGLACVDQKCERYCKPPALGGLGEQCEGAELCTPKNNSTPVYAVCEGPS